MAGHNEVEIKFEIADLGALARRLLDIGFRIETPRTHEMNVLYDAGQRLRRAGELLRLRQYGNTWKLTHKSRGSTGRHKSRVETETIVGDGEKLEAILRALGFAPSFRYEKFRTEWSDGQGHVVVDETPIGNIAEIEGRPEWIDATARALGIAPDSYITESYAAMFYAWKRRTRSSAMEMTFAAVEESGKKRPNSR